MAFSPALTKSLQEAADRIGCSRSFLYQRRDGNEIDMGDGQVLRILRVGRRLRVADIELERFLRGAPPNG